MNKEQETPHMNDQGRSDEELANLTRTEGGEYAIQSFRAARLQLRNAENAYILRMKMSRANGRKMVISHD